MRRFFQRLVGLLAVFFTLVAPPAHAGKKPYDYYVTGNPDATVAVTRPPSEDSLVLMGGGPDVDEAFRWMISRAGIRPGTGGRFVVLQASARDTYGSYIFASDATLSTTATPVDGWVGGASLGLTSVEAINVPSTGAANDDFVNAVVARADAIFITGGDQSNYIAYWKGTALERTLQAALARHVPVGGTSAGMAVLGQFDFTAARGTVTSAQALSDPYNKYMTFDPAPLSLSGGFLTPDALADVITDTHLDSRDRMGRFMTFIARLVAPSGGTGCPGGVLPATGRTGARGIGVDVETALLVQGNGAFQPVTARRVTNVSTTSESAVYFVRPTLAPTVCAPGQALTMRNIEVRKLADSNVVFDLSNWTGTAPLYVDVINGALTASPY
jgi:cyanophycinase-like exopeptidase